MLYLLQPSLMAIARQLARQRPCWVYIQPPPAGALQGAPCRWCRLVAATELNPAAPPIIGPLQQLACRRLACPGQYSPGPMISILAVWETSGPGKARGPRQELATARVRGPVMVPKRGGPTYLNGVCSNNPWSPVGWLVQPRTHPADSGGYHDSRRKEWLMPRST